VSYGERKPFAASVEQGGGMFTIATCISTLELTLPSSLQTVISTVFLTPLNHELLVFLFALWQGLPAVSLVGPCSAAIVFRISRGCGADTTFFCFAPSLLTYFLEFLGVVVLTHPFPVMVFVDNHESSRKIIAEAVACTLYQEYPDLTGTKAVKENRKGDGEEEEEALAFQNIRHGAISRVKQIKCF
jgi:hypothetical protein